MLGSKEKFNMSNKVLLLTIDPVPKIGRGGPGAVVGRLIKELNSKRFKYGWFSMLVSNRPLKETRQYGALILLRLLKSFTETSLLKWLKMCPVLGNLLRSLISEIRLISFFKNIHKYEKLLWMNYDKILSAHVIHCHDIYSIIALSKVLNDQRISKPILLSIHSPGSTSEELLRQMPEERFTRFGKYLKLYELYAISLATALVMPSKGAVNLLLKDLPLVQYMRKRIYVVYNGIEPIRLKSKDNLRRRLNLSSEDILIVAIGRLVPEKGFDVLIKAIKHLSDSGISNVHVAIAGKGMQREALEKLAESLNLKSKIHFLGYVKDISSVYSVADIFVSSSRRSAFDLTILEALSAGLPIVATDVGGNREAIDDAGIIVEPANPKALAEAIRKLIRDKRLRKELSLKARKRFEERFHVKSMAYSYVQVWNEIVKTYSSEK